MLEESKSSLAFQDPSNMHEFYQPHRSTDKWTKIHPIKQVIGDPSKPVMTRRRLHTDVEMYMYALTVSTTEPKNIREAMLDHSWIESMQEEPNQFKRLDVWELVERPVGRNIIAVKWIWKNKTDAENTVIRNKSRLVSKGYGQEEGIDFEKYFACCKTRSCQNFCGIRGSQELYYLPDGCQDDIPERYIERRSFCKSSRWFCRSILS
ncbi:retrovirus-related pol polyprotein from transposon TNT 1-94 [Tanacetum coccineum]|uniref:Retrovirus-related pol polyprotein from transposon TNT 1-94 n=1 Tax=Tanacetum coccineum TaxID=301880 RepID=A0ABQ5B5S6_9ASTR